MTLLPCVLSPRRFGQIKLSTSSWARRQGGWQQQGEVRDLVSPRTRPHPSHIPSSPPPLTTLTPACHVRRPRRRAALCATLVVKELYYIRPMASGQLIDASKTYFRPFLRTCACGLRPAACNRWTTCCSEPQPAQALLPTASAGGAGPSSQGAPGISPDHLIT